MQLRVADWNGRHLVRLEAAAHRQITHERHGLSLLDEALQRAAVVAHEHRLEVEAFEAARDIE